MRTTVDLPDPVLRRAKAAAALAGKSLKLFLLEAVTQRLDTERSSGASPNRVRLPLVPSGRPGALQITGDTVADALEAEDTGALAGR